MPTNIFRRVSSNRFNDAASGRIKGSVGGASQNIFNEFFEPVVGGGSYSLPVSVATFTRTGLAANVLRGIQLPVTKASFNETGVDNILRKANVLPVVVSPYALSSPGSTLRRASLLPVDKGTYTLNGINNVLSKGVLFVGSPASFILSGKDALLTKQFALPVVKGTYTLGGNSANLILARLLSIERGIFALTGRDNSFLYNPLGGGGLTSQQIYDMKLAVFNELNTLRAFNDMGRLQNTMSASNGSTPATDVEIGLAQTELTAMLKKTRIMLLAK